MNKTKKYITVITGIFALCLGGGLSINAAMNSEGVESKSSIALQTANEVVNETKYDEVSIIDKVYIGKELNFLFEYNLNAYWKHANGSVVGATGGTVINDVNIHLKTNKGEIIDVENHHDKDETLLKADGKSSWGVSNSSSKTSGNFTFMHTISSDVTSEWDSDEYVEYIGFNIDFEKSGTASDYTGEASVPLLTAKIVDDKYIEDYGHNSWTNIDNVSGKYLANEYDSKSDTLFGKAYAGNNTGEYKYVDLNTSTPEFLGNTSSYEGYQMLMEYNKNNTMASQINATAYDLKQLNGEFDTIAMSQNDWNKWVNNNIYGFTQAEWLQELLTIDGKKLDVSTNGETANLIESVEFEDDHIIRFNLQRIVHDGIYSSNHMRFKIVVI